MSVKNVVILNLLLSKILGKISQFKKYMLKSRFSNLQVNYVVAYLNKVNVQRNNI